MQLQRVGFSQLPDDPLKEALGFLNADDLATTLSVCKAWKQVAENLVLNAFLKKVHPGEAALRMCVLNQATTPLPQLLGQEEEMSIGAKRQRLKTSAQRIIECSRAVLSRQEFDRITRPVPSVENGECLKLLTHAGLQAYIHAARSFLSGGIAPQNQLSELGQLTPKTQAFSLAHLFTSTERAPLGHVVYKGNITLIPLQLQHVRSLDLRGNQIQMTPLDCKAIQSLPLHSLDLSGNPIVPGWEDRFQADLPQLEFLTLTDANLRDLPALCQCKQLHTLDLKNNQFDHFPLSLQMLPNLVSINLAGNPIDARELSTFIFQIAQDIKNPQTGVPVRTSDLLRIRVDKDILGGPEIQKLAEDVRPNYTLRHNRLDNENCDCFELRRVPNS